MQNYTEISEDIAVEDSRELLLNNDKTAMSNNAGVAFPTENLFVGMMCYRTDEEKMYTLKSISPLAWVRTDADTLGGVAAALYAKLASPNLSGTPTTPTAAAGANTNQIANCAFVLLEVARLVNSAPGTLDTLKELATALGNDPNFATTITNMIAGKEPVFAKNNAFNKNFGSAAGTVCQGNDARLSNARPANGGTSAACSGNAATATALQTARTINGVAFNGTGNITISAAANGGTSAACSGNAATATTARDLAGGNVITRSAESILEVSGTSTIIPRIRWHIPNVRYSRISMTTDGVLHVQDGGNETYTTIKAGNFVGAINGLAVATGRNSVANQIVRTNSSGYIDVQYINTNSPIENGNIANILYDNGDGYIRKASLQHLKNSIGMGSYSVGNAANKIPVYSATGHLVLPSGAELW